jgi:glycosyltransferase involved in cell wall biosynthesis
MGHRRRRFKQRGALEMSRTVGIVTPAFRAADWIVPCVKSVLAQTYQDWEHWIIADDGEDYERLLGEVGLADPRQRFRSTGLVGSGASRARNVGLGSLATPYGATLDADDRFKPEKLARAVTALEDNAIASMAIDERTPNGTHLRDVGAAFEGPLRAASYKWVNLSMDSMIVWDRRRTDALYDPDLPNMNDLDFLLKLFARAEGTWHIGTTLHEYVKLTQSLSNGAGVTERMIAAKRTILKRLKAGGYPMLDPRGADGMAAFLTISLEAEASYPAALADHPALLFEDHLEPMLGRAPV